MKSVGIIGLFFIFVVVSGIGAAIFAELFMRADTEDMTNEMLNAQILKNYSDLHDELKETGTWITSLDNQVKSLKASIDKIKKEKSDALKAKEIKAAEKKEYTPEEIAIIQNQIDELEHMHNLIKALIISSNQEFTKKTEDEIKLFDEEEQAAREERRKERRVQEKVQMTDYIKDNFTKKLVTLKEELNLSDGQEKAVAKILEDTQKKILEYVYPDDDGNSNRSNRLERQRNFRNIQTQFGQDVEKVLTPNQFDDFKSKKLNSLVPNQRGN